MSQVTSFSQVFEQVFEQEIETAWSETISNLTPEEKEILKKITLQDCIQAIIELAKSPDFWMSIGAAFVTGIAQGFSKAMNDL